MGERGAVRRRAVREPLAPRSRLGYSPLETDLGSQDLTAQLHGGAVERSDSVGWLTTRRLYGFFLLVSVVGFLLPLVTNYVKPADSPLHAWSWHPRTADHSGLYERYLFFNLIALALEIVLRRRIESILSWSLRWLRRIDHRRPRALIFAFVCLVVVSCQTHLHVGFWFYGIPGWTYADWTAGIVPLDPAAPPPAPDTSLEERSFLALALQPEAAQHLPTAPALVQRRAMFLHFDGGGVLPANLELAGLVFPLYAFGPGRWPDESGSGRAALPTRELRGGDAVSLARVSNHDVLARAVQRGLRQRVAGRRFLLPETVAYPAHAFYEPIDYTGYPGAGDLRAISFWRLTVHVDRERRPRLVNAERHALVEVPD